jgi:hypothetical protein
MTESQTIETMRDLYGKIEAIDPCQPTYIKLCGFLDSLDDDTLKALSDARIKWVSSLSLNRCIRRGII